MEPFQVFLHGCFFCTSTLVVEENAATLQKCFVDYENESEEIKHEFCNFGVKQLVNLIRLKSSIRKSL